MTGVSTGFLRIFASFAIRWALWFVLLYLLLVGIARVARSPVIVVNLQRSTERPFGYIDVTRAFAHVFEPSLKLNQLRPNAWASQGRYGVASRAVYDSYTGNWAALDDELPLFWQAVSEHHAICQARRHNAFYLCDLSTLAAEPLFPDYAISSFQLAADGVKSAFTVQHDDGSTDIYVADALDAIPRLLFSRTSPFFVGAWSSGGRCFLVYEESYSQARYYLVDVETDTMRSINADFGINAADLRSVVWSPDGTKLAFQSITTTYLAMEEGPFYVLDVDTGQLTQISDAAGDNPAWSPNSQHLLVGWAERQYYAADAFRIAHHVYSVNVDGSGWSEIAQDANVVWLPDSEHVIVAKNGVITLHHHSASQPLALLADFGQNGGYRLETIAVWR